MSGIEIYLKKVDLNLVLDWLDSKFKQTNFEVFLEEADYILYRYDGLYRDRAIPVIIQLTQVETRHSIVTSIWFNATATPWISSLECGREAYRYLKIPIICEPDRNKYPYPGDFVLIDKQGERIVCLDEE